MKELLKSVEALAIEELANSYKKFPKFVSSHEGYAVLLEEVQEHQEDTKSINVSKDRLWSSTRCNNQQAQILAARDLKDYAIHAAAEAIQVAAMAQKYIDSLGGEPSCNT